MSIDPSQYMIKLQGREYLPVAPRVVMFREAHPEWAIVTELVDNGGKGLVKAYIQDAGGGVIATAHKTVVSFKGGDVEKAETGAIGRALSLAGFGTIAAQDLDEGEQIADAPVERNGAKPEPTLPSGDPRIREMVREALDEAPEDAERAGELFDAIQKAVEALRGKHRENSKPYLALARVGLLGPDMDAAALKWARGYLTKLVGDDDWPEASKALEMVDAATEAASA